MSRTQTFPLTEDGLEYVFTGNDHLYFQRFAAIARKIAYSIIFTGFIVVYIIVTIRPPVDFDNVVFEPVTDSLQMLANQSDSSPVQRMLTFGDFVDAISSCKNGTENKFCYLTPVEDVLSIERPVYLSNYRNPCWSIPEDFLEGPPIKCLPYFFLIGAPKSGTTDLYEKLSRHPQISGMVKKELHWFTRRRFTYKTMTKLPQLPFFSNYTDLFQLASQDIFDNEVDGDYHKKVVGDCSVSTLWDNSYGVKYGETIHQKLPRTAESIYHINPNMKFISILRNPVERTYSDFLFFNSENEKSQDKFHDLVVEGIHYHQSCLKFLSINDCLDKRPPDQKEVRLFVGFYYYYLKEFMDVFQKDQFFVMKLEDYSPNVHEYLVKMFDFLELDPISKKMLDFVAPLDLLANKQTRKIGDMYPKTRQLLQDFFRPYNDLLAELLGDNFNYNNDYKAV